MSDLDLKEQNHVRTALRHLRRRVGTRASVAEARHCSPKTLINVLGGTNAVSASMALRVARLLDAPMDDLLAGRFLPGACPKCGHVPDFADENTAVEAAPRPTAGLALVK